MPESFYAFLLLNHTCNRKTEYQHGKRKSIIISMAKDTSNVDLAHRKPGLLKDQVRLIKRKDSDRYEIAPIPDNLSFEKGFFVVVRACQLLAQKNDGLILIGVAGPSGAGKTAFTEKILNFMPSIAVISMDNYNDASRIIDGNFDDPRLTDYDTLLKNIQDLKTGKPVDVPVYDFKSSSRTGYRTLEVPSSRIVVIEGIYALSEKLRPFLDLRVSVTGGVHFDLVKRVLRDIQRAGQEPEEIIHQISETVYPMYKAFIEPDLRTAHIKIINKFNPFTGFQSPTYILKSMRDVTVEQVKSVMSEEHAESTEQTYDIYLLPPGEDPETCQSYLRMRNKDGKYNLMFEEWVTDHPFVISPRITFEVSVRLLGGLMALGYTIAAILKRSSHVFSDERVCVKIDWLEQLNRHYVQVQGRDRIVVKCVAEQLGLEGSYVPRTYIEQIQLEKLVNEVMALPDDLKTKLSIDEDSVSSPKEALSRASAERAARIKNLRSGMSHSYSTNRDKNLSKNRRFEDRTADSSATLANQGAVTHLSEQISTLNDRMDDFTSRIEELNSKLTSTKSSPSSQNIALQAETYNGSAPTSYFISGLGNGSLTGPMMPNSSSSSQLAKESSLFDELSSIARGQRQVMHQLDNLSNLLREKLEERSERDRRHNTNVTPENDLTRISIILASLAVSSLGIFWFKGLLSRN
ncbi:uridine-cytidine kinase C isoform X2 [Sesamum indicum]|uniref:Uridine-cytidine kinase C isoform X2 n=1 Tax=Sesamum indicum TaxID=4182 RepID=A0A8M8UTX3_SESIN|nr:uridine-cytidine kinase C isoform X2 [Sesamum indicum]